VGIGLIQVRVYQAILIRFLNCTEKLNFLVTFIAFSVEECSENQGLIGRA
jgi:hypothetical protein